MNPVLITGISSGILRASQNGGSWATEKHLPGMTIQCLTASPANLKQVYAGTKGNGIFSSSDSGKNWTPLGLADQNIKSIAISPHHPEVIYAGAKPARIFKSADGGGTWTELEGFRKVPGRRFWFSPAEPPFTAYVQGLSVSPSSPLIILAGIEFGAVVRSDDGGKTWSGHRKGALRDCHSLTFHSTNGNYAYEGGGTGAGAAFSRDGGQTWIQNKNGRDRYYGWACAADPGDPEIWYASASTGPFKAHAHNGDARANIYRSRQNGPWEKLQLESDDPMPHMPYGLLTHPTMPGHLWASLDNGDFWHTSDYGDSWEKIPVKGEQMNRAAALSIDN